jgi:hypothetical protein
MENVNEFTLNRLKLEREDYHWRWKQLNPKSRRAIALSALVQDRTYQILKLGKPRLALPKI